MDLRDACRQFIKNGISDLTAVENLKDSFSAAAQLPVEHDDVIKSKLRTAVMNVILTCKNSVTGLSVDEENGLEAYRELCGLVLTGVEYLRAGELLTATGKLEQIHLTMAQLLYYFIKSSITQNFVADLLPVIVLLQDFIRDCISTPGFTGTANVSIESDLLNICATTYPFLLNWGIKALSKADHIQYMEVMDVLLAAIPFKTFAVQFTPPDPGALTWTVRLCAVIKMVKKADRADVPYAVLYQSVMTTLRRCRNVSVEDLLMVNEELVVILTASSDRELQGDKLTQTLTKGLEFIDADGKFRPLREQIVAVMKAQWLFSGAHETIRTATAAAQAIGKKNEAVRQLTKQKAKSSSASRPSRLNFDDHGDVKQEDFQSMQMLSDAVSLSDEKSLMLPMVHILEALELAFSNWPDPAGDVNRLRVGEEAATFLLELSHFFHFHRLHYLALSAAQLSWKLVCGFSGDKSLVLEAASAFMLTLRVFHLYDRRSVLVYEKSKNLAADCQEDHPLVYGLWLAEAGWVLLLSSQRRKGEGRHPCTEPGGSRSCVLRKCWRLQSDAAFSALLSLKSIWEKLDAKAEDEHKFAVPFLKAHYFRLAAGMTQVEPRRFREWMEMPSIMSQLSMLESGKTESSLCLSCVRQSSLSQLFAAKDLFLQVLLDIGQFLIRIGAPVEAFPHFVKGQRFANSELSCRWNMVFLAGLIQCRQNLGRTSEASASLHELNGLLSNQNASILSALTKPGPKTKSARDSRVVDIDCLAAVTEQMALTIRRGAGEEPGSAPDSDPFNAYCSDRIAQLPLLKHSKKCSCSECVDYDLHASFLESIYLAMLDSKRRAELFNEGKEHYETLKLKYIAVASLLKNSGLADGEKTDDAVPAIIALGITKLRLRNAAITFPGFKPSDRLAEIANRLNAYSELRITHPDIFMFTRYLEALNLVITETGTVHELDALIASQWSMPGGCAPGAVIKDRLTAMFPSTPQRSRAKSSSQRANAQPESRSVTPEKETTAGGKGRPKARPAEFAVAPERHRAVRKNPKLAEVDEPAIPADMAEEIAAQPTRLAKRRDTMLIEFKENRDDMEAEEVLSLANTSSLQSSAVLSDGMQKAITILEEALEFMRPSPIYPYNRMTATLLQLLTGTRGHGFDDASIQRKLAELSAACVSGKLQHLSLAYYNRLIPASKPAVQEEMIRRAEYLTFHPGSSVLNTKLLPSGWVVCSICCATQLTLPVRASSKPKILHLMVTRWEHGVEPITLQVTTKDRFQAATLENLADILQRANENQTNHATIRAYWATRLHLNQETMDLTDSMEKLLGFAKALLLSPLLDGKDKKTKANLDTLKAVVKRDKLDVPDSILRLLVTAGGTLTTEQLIPLTSSLIKEPERSAPVVSLVTAMTKFLPNPAAARAPLILVLDNDMYGLPWESIPILRNQPVSRLPSIQFVNLHLEEHRRNELLKLNKVFYIVNPDRDLMNAQNNFHNFLGKFELKESWNGVSGMAPSSDQVKSAFEDHELILYTGHGSGSHIFNLSFFDSCRTSASMFLVGCSSVRLESSISMDGSGFLHQALMMGSPYVTGNLWSVTSACMDAFMGFILETILRKKESGKLDATDNCFLRLLATTRDRISSNYLVGAAPVFVGLPVTY